MRGNAPSHAIIAHVLFCFRTTLLSLRAHCCRARRRRKQERRHTEVDADYVTALFAMSFIVELLSPTMRDNIATASKILMMA